jgi:hypothetical protein
VFTPIPILPLEEILNHCALDDEETVKRLSVSPACPVSESTDEGVDDPIPTFPLEDTLKNEALDDEATLKISFVEPDTPRTLKAIVDDVAFTPSTVPLSMSVEVPSVVEVSQRVAKPTSPPVTPTLVRPSDVVATQRVEVPVV